MIDRNAKVEEGLFSDGKYIEEKYYEKKIKYSTNSFRAKIINFRKYIYVSPEIQKIIEI